MNILPRAKQYADCTHVKTVEGTRTVHGWHGVAKRRPLALDSSNVQGPPALPVQDKHGEQNEKGRQKRRNSRDSR